MATLGLAATWWAFLTMTHPSNRHNHIREDSAANATQHKARGAGYKAGEGEHLASKYPSQSARSGMVWRGVYASLFTTLLGKYFSISLGCFARNACSTWIS